MGTNPKKLFIQHLIKHKKEVLENLNGRKKIYEFLKSKRFSMMEDMNIFHQNRVLTLTLTGFHLKVSCSDYICILECWFRFQAPQSAFKRHDSVKDSKLEFRWLEIFSSHISKSEFDIMVEVSFLWLLGIVSFSILVCSRSQSLASRAKAELKLEFNLPNPFHFIFI